MKQLNSQMRGLALLGFLLAVVPLQAQTVGLPGALSPKDAIELAFSHRAVVQSAIATLAAAKSDRRALIAYPASHVEAGTATRPDITGGEDLTLFVPLEVFGRVSAAKAQGNADLAKAKAEFKQTLLDVQADALEAYLNLAAAQRLLQTSQLTLSVAERVKKATDTLVGARALPEIQQIRTGFEVRRVRQLVVDRQAAVKTARTRLAGALGASDAPDLTVDLSALDATMIATVDVNQSRPDLVSLKADVDRAAADVRADRLLRLPTLEAQFRRSPWSTDEQYGARIQLSIPLWDDGSAKATLDAASKKHLAAEKLLLDHVQSALKECEAAQLELDAAASSRASYADLSKEAAQLLQKVQRGYELGAATLLDVLDAQKAQTDTAEEGVAAEQRYGLAVASLIKAKGQLLAGQPLMEKK